MGHEIVFDCGVASVAVPKRHKVRTTKLQTPPAACVDSLARSQSTGTENISRNLANEERRAVNPSRTTILSRLRTSRSPAPDRSVPRSLQFPARSTEECLIRFREELAALNVEC